MADERVYTYVSGKALRGLQRLVPSREVYFKESASAKGYTVVTRDVKTGKFDRSSMGRASRA
jgi:hypothetical protein